MQAEPRIAAPSVAEFPEKVQDDSSRLELWHLTAPPFETKPHPDIETEAWAVKSAALILPTKVVFHIDKLASPVARTPPPKVQEFNWIEQESMVGLPPSM